MSEFNNIIKDSKPTLVDFFATWCGPCKMMHPILEKSAQFRVQSVPTLIIFKDGEVKWRAAGVHTAEDLEAKLKEFM